jgi:hypothetical protein
MRVLFTLIRFKAITMAVKNVCISLCNNLREKCLEYKLQVFIKHIVLSVLYSICIECIVFDKLTDIITILNMFYRNCCLISYCLPAMYFMFHSYYNRQLIVG